MNTYSHSSSGLYRLGTVSQPTVIKRGNLSVLATAEFRGGQMVSTPVNRQRYVWPNPYSQNNSSMSARKAYAR